MRARSHLPAAVATVRGVTVQRLAWIDASAGVAGDMLLGALVDAGADLAACQAAVDAVVPGAVRLRRSEVVRAGLRAAKVDVDVLVDDPPHRTWATVRALLEAADLAGPVRDGALAVFERLAEAEGRVHGVPASDVHFHEVGALDAVADVVGTCAALHALGVTTLVTSPVALGSGTARAAHGSLPVPVPAVLELARGWDVLSGGSGELATPTGVALLTALAQGSGPLPALRVEASGVGAGTRDTPGRANVVRVVLGSPAPLSPTPLSPTPRPDASARRETAVLLETTVDDLDPRVWPDVLAHLLAVGALDAWLTPVLMKKGRPGHVLSVLSGPLDADVLVDAVLGHTSTLGVRRNTVERDVLERAWVQVALASGSTAGPVSGSVRVKVGHRAGVVVQAMPEFTDVQALAHDWRQPVAQVLVLARAAAVDAGLAAGRAWPGAPG